MSTRWLSHHSPCFIARSPPPIAIPSYTWPNQVRSKTSERLETRLDPEVGRQHRRLGTVGHHRWVCNFHSSLKLGWSFVLRHSARPGVERTWRDLTLSWTALFDTHLGELGAAWDFHQADPTGTWRHKQPQVDYSDSRVSHRRVQLRAEEEKAHAKSERPYVITLEGERGFRTASRRFLARTVR